MDYPDTEGRAYSFNRGELRAGNRLLTAISNVSIAQPTEVEAAHGTRPGPLVKSVGQQDLGDGTIDFSDIGELFEWIDELGDAYREKNFTLKWILSAPGRPDKKIVAYGCSLVDEPIEHEGGPTPLGGSAAFKFMYHTINGKRPHSDQPKS
jgi:hypothetical protein